MIEWDSEKPEFAEPEEAKPEEAKTESDEEKTYKEKRINRVAYELKVNRENLFHCFNAIDHLAAKSGEITITVVPKLKRGVDPEWLRNAVEEPMEETGIEVKKLGKRKETGETKKE